MQIYIKFWSHDFVMYDVPIHNNDVVIEWPILVSPVKGEFWHLPINRKKFITFNKKKCLMCDTTNKTICNLHCYIFNYLKIKFLGRNAYFRLVYIITLKTLFLLWKSFAEMFCLTRNFKIVWPWNKKETFNDFLSADKIK